MKTSSAFLLGAWFLAQPASATNLGFSWKPKGTPLTVAAVAPSSPAAAAKFEPGDAILKVETTAIETSNAFDRAVRSYAPGSRIRIRVRNRSVVKDRWLVVDESCVAAAVPWNEMTWTNGRLINKEQHPYSGWTSFKDDRGLFIPPAGTIRTYRMSQALSETRKQEYQDGFLVKETDTYPDGRLKHEILVDGKRAKEEPLDSGGAHAWVPYATSARFWAADGTPLGEMTYQNGEPWEGTLVEWNEHHVLETRSTYRNGKMTLHEYFNPSTGLFSEKPPATK